MNNNPAGSEITVESLQSMYNNYGTVTENYGSVFGNHGTVTDNFNEVYFNYGTVTNNNLDGTIPGNLDLIVNNYGTIRENIKQSVYTGIVENNFGTIQENNGDVGVDYYNPDMTYEERLAALKTGNFGTVEKNTGTIFVNQEGGVVGAYLLDEDGNPVLDSNGNRVLDPNSGNYGTIDRNKGSLFINNGKINVNSSLVGAYLLDKDGNPVLDSNGNPVIDPNSGSYGSVDVNVDVNIGIIINHGKVQLNGGTVYNYGGTVDYNDSGTEYFSVEIINDTSVTHTDHAYGNEFHSYSNRLWLGNVNGSNTQGTVLLTPNEGYVIIDIAVPEGGTLESAVKNNDGTWTLTFRSGENTVYEVPTATEILTPNQNGYGMNNSLNPSNSNNQTQPQPEHTSARPVSLEDYFLITLTNHTTGDVQTMAYSFASAAPAPAGNAVTTTYDSFTAEKIAAVKTAPKDGVVEIDLRETGWTALKRDIFEAAAARGDVTIIIYYSHWGRDYTLTIPAGTALTAEMAGAQFLEVSQLPGLLGLSAV